MYPGVLEESEEPSHVNQRTMDLIQTVRSNTCLVYIFQKKN